MKAHPLWGWALLLVLLITSLPVRRWSVGVIDARESKIWGQRVVELSNHWAAENKKLAGESRGREAALFRMNSEKDDALLNERLTGLELNGFFHTYLADNVDHSNLDFQFVSQLEEHLAKWRRDSREFFDPELTAAWERLSAAAKAYNQTLEQYTWMKDDSSRLHVPPEWKDKDYQLYRTAFNELSAARAAFYVSLCELHKVQHAKGLASSAQDSDIPGAPRGMVENNVFEAPTPTFN